MSLIVPQQRGRVASTRHFWVMLALLAFFPVVLRGTGALAVLHISPDAPGNAAALLRFCSVLMLYLWLLLVVVWVGVKSYGEMRFKDVIGVAKSRSAGFLSTAAAALATFALLLFAGAGANALFQRLGVSSGTMQGLTVHTTLEALAFLALALSAGFVEEVVFRGYLQQQLYARTGSIVIASVLQIAIFTVGHMYQGWARLIPVALEGAILTLVALWRRSLVPGMIAHGVGDGLMAIAFLLRLVAK